MAEKFKCVHCNKDMPIPFKKLVETVHRGKSVVECENCNKLNTVRNDEGTNIYIT